MVSVNIGGIYQLSEGLPGKSLGTTGRCSAYRVIIEYIIVIESVAQSRSQIVIMQKE